MLFAKRPTPALGADKPFRLIYIDFTDRTFGMFIPAGGKIVFQTAL
jgi:hypothetical protein